MKSNEDCKIRERARELAREHGTTPNGHGVALTRVRNEFLKGVKGDARKARKAHVSTVARAAINAELLKMAEEARQARWADGQVVEVTKKPWLPGGKLSHEEHVNEATKHAEELAYYAA